MAYHNMRNDVVADSLYREFFSLPIMDSTIYAQNMMHYARVLVSKSSPEPEKAKKLFSEAKNVFRLKPSLADYYIYAYALELENKRKEVDILLRQLKQIDSVGVPYYGWNYKIHKKRGDTREALHYFEGVYKLQDSIIVSNLRQSLQKAQKEFFVQKATNLENMRHMERLKLSVIILLLVCVVIILVSVFHKKNAEKRGRILELSSIRQIMESQLLKKEIESSEKDRNIQLLRKEYFNHFRNQYIRLDELCEAYFSPVHKTAKDKIYDYVSTTLREIADSERTPSYAEDLVNGHLNNLIIRLRSEIPSLKEQDFRLISFFILGFSAKTISAILNISPENIYTRKSRIRAIIASSYASSKDDIMMYIG